MCDHSRNGPFRELLALFVVAVGLIATIALVAFLVFALIWLGTSGIEWLVEFFQT